MSFTDPMLATLTVLRGAMSGLTFGTKLYEEFPAETAPSLPYVLVRNDGTAVKWPVSATALIGLTIYTPTEAEGYPHAFAILGALRSHPGDAAVRSFSADAASLISTIDPDTRLYMTSFSVDARLRPTP